MTSFTATTEDFIPAVNMVSEEQFVNLTYDNVRRHPDAFLTACAVILLLLLGFGLLKNYLEESGKDRPIFARSSVWDL